MLTAVALRCRQGEVVAFEPGDCPPDRVQATQDVAHAFGHEVFADATEAMDMLANTSNQGEDWGGTWILAALSDAYEVRDGPAARRPPRRRDGAYRRKYPEKPASMPP